MADLRFKARSVYLGNKVSVWLLQELEMSIMSLSTERVWIYYGSHHPPATSEVYVVKSVCMHAHMCKNVKDGWGEKNGHLVNLPNVTNSCGKLSPRTCFCLGTDWPAQGDCNRQLLSDERLVLASWRPLGRANCRIGNVGFVIKLRVREALLKFLLAGWELKLHTTASCFLIVAATNVTKITHRSWP